MNVSCPQCSTIYRVDPAKVPQGGVRARCSACGGVIPVGINASGPQRQVVSDPIGDAFASRPATPRPFVPATPAARPAMSTPPAQPRTPTPPSHPMPSATLPGVRTPPIGQPMVTPRRVTPVTPISVPAVTPPPAPPSAPPVQHSFAAPASSSAAPSSPAPGRRPINPFLSRDPSLRAKRLARALVSDMVAYYPAKHAEGLEKGTLKELFREEIKKSYEEYVAQVGSDFARSTTHFQESLNEVLGAGKKIF
jgi:predicted Zn finger-like uncharacterized protein